MISWFSDKPNPAQAIGAKQRATLDTWQVYQTMFIDHLEAVIRHAWPAGVSAATTVQKGRRPLQIRKVRKRRVRGFVKETRSDLWKS